MAAGIKANVDPNDVLGAAATGGSVAALAGIAASPHTAQFVQGVANKAATWFSDSGLRVPARTAGIFQHSFAQTTIDAYQGAFGDVGKGLSTEVSYLGGATVDYGVKGSTRLDVVEGELLDPHQVFDFKFGEGGFSNDWITKFGRNVSFGSTPQIVRPQ